MDHQIKVSKQGIFVRMQVTNIQKSNHNFFHLKVNNGAANSWRQFIYERSYLTLKDFCCDPAKIRKFFEYKFPGRIHECRHPVVTYNGTNHTLLAKGIIALRPMLFRRKI